MGDSWFANLEVAQPIEVFHLSAEYNKDSHPNKVNLGVGAYRTNDGKPWVLPVVSVVEEKLASEVKSGTQNHEYLPVAGLVAYRDAGCRLLLGEDSPAIDKNRCGATQAIGGTGALRIGLDCLKSRMGFDTVYVSNPTWGNHKGIAKALGYGNVKEYTYWDAEKRELDLDGMIADLEAAPEKSAVLLHMCAHNPTGMDPSQEQWKTLAEVIRRKNIFPFFDCAYQGFASGKPDVDAWAVRYFVEQGFELFAAQSFSKNFGLYNERVGNLIFVASSSERKTALSSQCELIVRTTWSNSPSHGCKIVSTVLDNPAFYSEWKDHVKTMADRIIDMRKLLCEKLKALGTPGKWDHITAQHGMFSYTGLNKRQCKYLMDHSHIYLMSSGRINMCAVTTKNVDYIANSIHHVVCEVKADPEIKSKN